MTTIYTEDVWKIEVPGSGYTGWPTLTKTNSGELMAVYSGGRRHHVGPFGQVHLITSRDDGKSWTWPRILVDGVLDDRDAGILQTSKSTFIVNWFSSFLWESVMVTEADAFKNYPEAEQAEWERRHARLTDEIRQNELGVWSIRSTDGGASWSNKIDTVVGSPHGPCELSDGRLLYVGKKGAANFRDGDNGSAYCDELGVAESTDDGQSWKLIGDIPTMPEHDITSYHELHATQAANGDIIAHIRNHDEPHQYETLQTESQDGGKTWSTPHPIGIWGYPAFLLRASDDRLITSVGYRRNPKGNQIAISEDNGRSWSKSMPINTDSDGDFVIPSDSDGDFGYPSTVELSPGCFLTLWYDKLNSDQGYLRLARWRLD
ncbi:MAG: sialidase family protein [Abditibacteriaceae bacterium]